MLRQTTTDQVLRLDDHGHAVIAAHPQQARPVEVLTLRAERVPDLDALLAQGYAATHDQGIVTAWPAAAHPSQRRLPDGRLDVDREQRRLERARIVQAAPRPRPPRGPLPRRQRGGRP